MDGQSRREGIKQRELAFHFNMYTASMIADATMKPQAATKAEDKGTETNALHRSACGDLAASHQVRSVPSGAGVK